MPCSHHIAQEIEAGIVTDRHRATFADGLTALTDWNIAHGGAHFPGDQLELTLAVTFGHHDLIVLCTEDTEMP